MKIRDEHLYLNGAERSALDTDAHIVPIYAATQDRMLARYDELQGYIGDAQEALQSRSPWLRGLMACMSAGQPEYRDIAAFTEQTDLLVRVGGAVLVHEIEEAYNIPHQAAQDQL